MANNSSSVVEPRTHDPMFGSSNLATAGTRSEREISKKLSLNALNFKFQLWTFRRRKILKSFDAEFFGSNKMKNKHIF